MKLLRELGYQTPLDFHLALGRASHVVGLRCDQHCYPLRDEVSEGRLRIFHPLPGLLRVQFNELINWFETREERTPPKHYRRWPKASKLDWLPTNAWGWENRRRLFARLCVKHAMEIGLFERGRCFYCGRENAIAHHPDYDKPLLIVWLCPYHHQLHHSRINQAVSLFRKTSNPAQLELFPNKLIEQARAK